MQVGAVIRPISLVSFIKRNQLYCLMWRNIGFCDSVKWLSFRQQHIVQKVKISWKPYILRWLLQHVQYVKYTDHTVIAKKLRFNAWAKSSMASSSAEIKLRKENINNSLSQ